ncbi:MAG: radical SAM protein [Anaerolineales bacterium]
MEQFDVVLINPFPGASGINESTILPPLGLAYIGAVLEQYKYSVKIIDNNIEQLNCEKILKLFQDTVKLVGIYVNSFSFDSCVELTSLIKKVYPAITIVLGGPLPSAQPKMVINHIPCDGVICGEGEFAVLKMIQNIISNNDAFDSTVPGAVYYDSMGVLQTNKTERILDLDVLPFPAYHLLPDFTKYRVRSRKRPSASIVTSRGCAHNCAFCSKEIFERKVTFRSAENVLKEIDFLVNNYGIRQIDILDDNFMQKQSRVESILDGIINRKYKISINFQSGIRSENIDKAILKKMKQAGVYKIAFGVESADPKVLDNIHKRIDLDTMANAVQLAKQIGIEVYGFFIIGLPGETEEGFQKTLDFAVTTGFDIANFCMAVPFVGTELFNMVKKDGRFLIDTSRNIDNGFYSGKVFFEFRNMKEEEILIRYRRAYKEFYTPMKRLRIVFSIKSIHEIIWIWDSAKFVLKGMLKKI